MTQSLAMAATARRDPPDPWMPVIGAATAKLIATARVFAARGEIVLISGPTGSGKSRLAHWCHQQSPRRDQRFETLDLLGVPRDRQMAELVGSTSMPGALTRAAGGTLFIDEIEALSPEAQAGLSRVLEERRYRAPGDGASEREADVNFIVGTSTNLLAEVRAGRFREDLYYRVNVFPVRLPPLRERLDEVPEWAAYMLERSHGACARAHLTPAAVAALRAQPWPGNLRQLDNVVRRSHAFASVDRAPEARTELAVDERHVRHALALEGSPEDNLTRQLWSTARALAREAVRRREADANALSLETLDGFRGMVLGAVVQLLHSRDQAFRLFAREHLLNGRNHHRALKRELARTRRLVHALDDGYVDPELLALVELGRPAREVVRTVRPRA